ncbi:cobalt-precorrin-6A reductase [Marmoricola sp. RAF53]|uniref:cobalt-precorrin-6A reductase n=1 Tax=Marmoricola sp. RAF53 TaxID=3233059 RepID=UPI003F94DF17
MTVLVLGGTAEARALAALLVEDGVPVVSSLAGRVARPRLPVGEVRVGGFGGVEGLAEHLRGAGVTAVVDATHPFAAVISGNAYAACTATATPLLRLERPGWSGEPGAARWHWVDDNAAAAALTAELGKRPFLTVGRQGLAAYAAPLAERAALVRVVDPPEIEVPATWTVLEDRGPYDLAGEERRITAHRADVLVTKDSGGTWTRPKLDAADRLGIPVVVVRRPAGPHGVELVSTPADAAAWVRRQG